MNRRTFTQVSGRGRDGWRLRAVCRDSRGCGCRLRSRRGRFRFGDVVDGLYRELPFRRAAGEDCRSGLQQCGAGRRVCEMERGGFCARPMRRASGWASTLMRRQDCAMALPIRRSAEAFLKDLREALTPMETLELSGDDCAFGNVVPGLSARGAASKLRSRP